MKIINISLFLLLFANSAFAVDVNSATQNLQALNQMIEQKPDNNNVTQADQAQVIEDNKKRSQIKEITVDQNAKEKYSNSRDSQSMTIMRKMQVLNSEKPASMGSVDDSISNVGFKDSSSIKISVKKISINGMKMSKEKALNMAYDAFNSGDLESAAYYYKILLKEFPSDTDIMFQLATSYQLMMQDNDALQLYMKLIDKDPSNYDAINNMSIIMSNKDPDMALRELNKIRIKNNQQHQIMAQLGTIKIAIGKMDEGIEDLFAANNLNPGNPYYIYNIAIGFDKKGDHKLAIQYYNICLQYFKEDTRIDRIFIVDRVKYLKNKQNDNL